MENKKKKEKYLFTIDLDGTLLQNSATGEINKEDIKAIEKLKEEGHIICIVTGRPWRSSKKPYETLKLETIVANYNGAHIHNPSNQDFVPNTSYMNLNDIMYILGDPKIKKATANLAIEGPSWVMLEKRSKPLEKVFGFAETGNLKLGIDVHRLPLRPTGVVVDTKEGVNISKLRDYVQRTYGDLAEFSSWSKGEGLTPVFDMTAVGVTKSKALSLMARFYDVPLSRTIAIGDGFNDVPMFETAEISVAMKNAMQDVKRHATYITEKTNKDGGVAEFVNKFLGENRKEFISKLRKRRKEIRHIADQITVAH